MPGDALFEMLAQAKARPDKWARAVNAGAGAGQDILGGYFQGLNMRRQLQMYPLELAKQKAQIFDNYSKLADAVGPDRASQMMGPTLQQAGIDVSSYSPQPGSTGGSPYTSEQLTTMGPYGKNVLEAQKTAQSMALANQPRDPGAYKSAIMQTGLISPEAFDAWAQANTNADGKIPAQNADFLEKSLGLKAQGNRAEFYHTQVGRNQLELLPSLQPASSAPGAAYQVKVAARNGRALIAKAGTPQDIALATSDLSRAVNRSAPLAETINAANYGNNLQTLWSTLQQKLSSNPADPDIPEIRKKMYDTFGELDAAATPWIANHLQNMEDNGTNSSYGQKWGAVKNRELGLNIPEIPFSGTVSSGSIQNPNISTGIPTNPKDPAGLLQ